VILVVVGGGGGRRIGVQKLMYKYSNTYRVWVNVH
jgi:hypothetical protein